MNIRKAWRKKMAIHDDDDQRTPRERQIDAAEESARKARDLLAQDHGPAVEDQPEDDPTWDEVDEQIREDQKITADKVRDNLRDLISKIDARPQPESHEEAQLMVRDQLGDITIRSFTVFKNAVKVELGTKGGDYLDTFSLRFDHCDKPEFEEAVWAVEVMMANQLAPHLFSLAHNMGAHAGRLLAALPDDKREFFQDQITKRMTDQEAAKYEKATDKMITTIRKQGRRV